MRMGTECLELKTSSDLKGSSGFLADGLIFSSLAKVVYFLYLVKEKEEG